VVLLVSMLLDARIAVKSHAHASPLNVTLSKLVVLTLASKWLMDVLLPAEPKLALIAVLLLLAVLVKNATETLECALQ